MTVDELAAYLRQEVQISTDQNQNPQVGDLSRNGSLGGFFFLNRRRMVDRGLAVEWTPGSGVRFGADTRTLADSSIAYVDVASFAGGGVLSVVNPDSRAKRRVTEFRAAHPAWSPDGTRIAFASEDRDGAGIFVTNPAGETPRRIVGPEWAGNAPAWSPDGTRLAFSRNSGGVALVNVDGTGLQELIDRGAEPSWSPEGKRIAITHEQEILVLQVDGQPPKGPVSGISRWENPEGPSWNPRWSPDGTMIAYEGYRKSDGRTQIYARDADGGIERRVTSLAGPWAPCCPSWSPDGTRIAFATPEAIFVVSRDGGDPVRLIDLGWLSVSPNAFDRGYGPAWSPFLPK